MKTIRPVAVGLPGKADVAIGPVYGFVLEHFGLWLSLNLDSVETEPREIMMIYMTKVWGFGEPVGPLQFSMEGWRERARQMLKPGDLVVLVGTKNFPTDEQEQGKLLGIMEPTTEPVLSMDFDLKRSQKDLDENGNYKWPYGLLNRCAWLLLERPLLEEISGRQFSMDAALGLVPLTEQEAAKVMGLRKKEIRLLSPTVRTQARLDGLDAARRRASPAPATSRQGIMHMRRAPAFTYAMEIQGASVAAYKIGWAFDFKSRARQFNQAAMPELGGLGYVPIFSHLWDTAFEAYEMEQNILQRFNAQRHPHNHEIVQGITYDRLQSTWLEVMTRLRRR
ncbi:conserved hypothetical protein [Rhodospirillaceae bacterium LM-1]|nr:conserved hypothetical protein [Rhodospirillaceae bacterium LM-1]